MQQRDRRGAVGSFYEGEGAEVNWPPPPQVPTPLWAMRGQRGAPLPPRRLSKRSGQSSIGYRRRHCKTRGGGSSRAGGQRRADMRSGVQRQGIGRGGGMGPGVRAAGGASASSSARSGPAGPRCAGMPEGRDARAGQRRGMHEGGLRPKVRGNTGREYGGHKSRDQVREHAEGRAGWAEVRGNVGWASASARARPTDADIREWGKGGSRTWAVPKGTREEAVGGGLPGT